jgi:limonene-1,2-epoxide hydrolase
MVEKLTTEQIRDLWSKTYNTEGVPDWSHIFPYYHDEIVFQDSIQRIEGIEDFKAMCARLTSRCEQLNMDIQNVLMADNTALLEWIMTMSFKKFPSTPVYGCTRLTFAEDNRIIEQRDYFDMWGDIFNGIPRFKPLYRKFIKKRFG